MLRGDSPRMPCCRLNANTPSACSGLLPMTRVSERETRYAWVQLEEPWNGTSCDIRL